MHSNLSAVLHNKNEDFPRCDIILESHSLKEPEDGEVLVEMHNVGICGTDVHFWRQGNLPGLPIVDPIVTGHEGSGKIMKCGKNVKGLKKGDRVTIEPGVPLKEDEYFKNGRYNLSPKTFACIPPNNGLMRRFANHNANYCHKLPDNVSYEEGALIEPLSVVIHACRRANIQLGNKVLVAGAGPIGILSMMVAKVMGASSILVTDVSDTRLDMAKKIGADFILKTNNELLHPHGAQQICKMMGGSPDVAIECSGADRAVQLAIYAVKPGGVVTVVGLGNSIDSNIPLLLATSKEVDIRGSWLYCNTWPTAIQMLASKQIDVTPVITHRFNLEDVKKAFEVCQRGDGIKVMVDCFNEKV